MFPTWRLRLREARLACNSGRYEEASRMLADESLRDFLPAKMLARDVAGKMIERANGRFASGDSAAGWSDLNTADRLGGQADAVNRLRHNYVDQALQDVCKYLAARQPTPALQRLNKLRQRGLAEQQVRTCAQVARLMQEVEQSAARGHFVEATKAIERALVVVELHSDQRGIMSEVTSRLHTERGRLASANGECQRLTAEMHAALTAENWGTVLTAADAILSIAPRHAAAGQARRRAWKSVGMDVTQLHAGGHAAHDFTGRRVGPAGPVSLAIDNMAGRRGRRSTRPSSRSSEVDTVAGNPIPQRALLWVDAVGGFLVCLDDCIAIGQPAPGDPVAVPILADLSRRHALIRREAGAYVLEPTQRTLVDGREITGAYVLADNQLIQLGDNVRIRFNKPHALSATARLVLESHHKTQPSADAVLLMADSCVLGPNRHCHVRCRNWNRDVVVYRQNNQVFCRADEPLSVDGVAANNNCEIQSGVRVEGEAFSFAWETV